MSDSTTRILQSPQVRAVDNMKAILKIGQKVPTASGSFQPGIGGVGINPLVNTQFTFSTSASTWISRRTSTTTAKSPCTSKWISRASTDHVDLGGIDQPVIGQRKVTHDIRMKEGEVNVLGGLMQLQETKTKTGIPGLSSIPLVGRLFSAESVSKDAQRTGHRAGAAHHPQAGDHGGKPARHRGRQPDRGEAELRAAPGPAAAAAGEGRSTRGGARAAPAPAAATPPASDSAGHNHPRAAVPGHSYASGARTAGACSAHHDARRGRTGRSDQGHRRLLSGATADAGRRHGHRQLHGEQCRGPVLDAVDVQFRSEGGAPERCHAGHRAGAATAMQPAFSKNIQNDSGTASVSLSRMFGRPGVSGQRHAADPGIPGSRRRTRAR